MNVIANQALALPGSTAYLSGDCTSVLATLPDNVVQACVTSPPYFGLRSYLPDGHDDKILEIGQEGEVDAYIVALTGVFREVRRVLRPDGLLFLNLGDSYVSNGRYDAAYEAKKQRGGIHANDAAKYPNYDPRPAARSAGLKPKDLIGVPWRAALALQADGWYLRSAIVWNKPNPMPGSQKDRPTSSYEMVFMLAKSSSYFYDDEAVREPAVSTTPAGNGFKRPERQSLLNTDGSTRGSDEKWNGVGGMRTARDVWTIATKPYKDAHFATFPLELPTRCIKAATSEHGQCPHCGSPWERIVEKGEPDREHQAACGADSTGGYSGKATKDFAAAGAQDASATKARILAGMVEHKTIGWRPTCTCPAHDPVPQLVLDPFGGAGTTALAANTLGRDACLIDLHPDYPAMAEKRLGMPVMPVFIW